MKLMIDSKKLENEILASVNSVSNQDSLEEIRIAELGKKRSYFITNERIK
jgi:hypothetical protein